MANITYIEKINNTKIYAERAKYTEDGKNIDTELGKKATKVSSATEGNLASLDANGNISDSGVASANLVHDASYVHTDNNYTTAEKNKLSGIATGAQVNVIETVKVNGTAQTVTSKAVDISVPVAGTADPKMDGTASAGSATTWSKSDHVHPTDTSREASANKVSSWSATTTDTHYPSEKLVKDSIDAKAPLASPTFTGTPKAPTAAAGTNTTQIATTAFVKSAVDTAIAGVADALIYKGTVAGGSTGSYGALTPAADKGYLYKVSTAGMVDGVKVEVGDMLICNTDGTAAATSSNYSTIAEKWDFIQTNIDGYVLGPSSSVNAHIATFDGTTGKTIKDSGYTIATSVPSGAVFTDTKVTSSGNHYAPETATGEDKSASASGATAAWGIDVVKGVTLNTDGKGHVTGISVTSGKIPSNPNTDTKVKATAKTDDANYKILATASASPTSGNATEAVYDADITLNPSTNTISANISGNAATATAASSAVSGSTLATTLAGKQDSLGISASGDAGKFLNQKGAWITGPIGPSGPTGATGPCGPKGLCGPIGETGPQGVCGPSGVKGDTGSCGPRGFCGPIGLTGETGPKGFCGPKGSTGACGPIGLCGPKGDTGSCGPRGFCGPIGLCGPIGETGSCGPKGFCGPIGLTGGTGPKGFCGPIGLTGATGPCGPKGFCGPIGLTGGTGPQGFCGPMGSTGSCGPRGFCGPRGEWGGEVDQTYSATSTNPQSGTAVAEALAGLDVDNIAGFGAGKTLSALSETDGKISASFQDISITKSQVSDFSHTHGNIQNGGTLQTTDVTIANGDKLVVTDASDSNKIARSSVSFDGSTVGKSLSQKGTWEYPKEAYLEWGGKNFFNSFGPLDAALISELGANRFACGVAAGITIEYTRDGGTTWVDYGATDLAKRNIFTNRNSNITVGKADSTNKATTAENYANYKVRVIINCGTFGIYNEFKKFVFYVSSNGSSGCFMKMSGVKQAETSDVWTDIGEMPIGGWSGFNVYNQTVNMGTSSNATYKKICFLFECRAAGNTNYNGLSIISIFGYGGVGWNTPSTLARTGRAYEVDGNEGVTFPSKVTATSFDGKFATARKLAVSLSNTSTDTSFDGSADVTNIKTTGTLGIANGGTGRTTKIDAANDLLSALSEWVADPTDDTKLIRRDTGNTSQFGQVKFLTVWNYVKSKMSSDTGVNITGNAATATSATTATDYNTSTGTIKSALAGKVSTSTTVNGHALSGNVTVTAADVSSVRYDTASQGLTDTQKSNARTNIGAGTSNLALGTSSTTAAKGDHTHGNIQNGGTLQTNDVTIASGDKLVVTDSSDSSKIARASVSFDGSTTTTALTPKGTFESFAKAADITSAIQALDVSSVGGAGKYISAISEADGKISATATSMDTTPTASSTNAVTSGGVKAAIDAAVSSAYHHAGTKTVAQLVSTLLVADNEGNVYNITDSGTTTSDFIEGAGYPIRAGDNVGICNTGSGVYKFDLLSGFVDLSNYIQKSSTAGLVKNNGTIDTSSYLTTTGAGQNVTSTFTKNASDTSGMTSGGKLSAIFTAISNFFASLKALAFKDKVADGDISGTISDSHIASASTWSGKQNALPTSGTASTTYAINVSGTASNIAAGGSSGQYLKSNGSGNAPSWATFPTASTTTAGMVTYTTVEYDE